MNRDDRQRGQLGRVHEAVRGAAIVTAISVGITNVLVTAPASVANRARIVRETRRAVGDGERRRVPDSAPFVRYGYVL